MKSTSFFSILTSCLFAAVVGVAVAAIGCGSDSDEGKSDSGAGGSGGDDGAGGSGGDDGTGGGGGSATGGAGGGSSTCAKSCDECKPVPCDCNGRAAKAELMKCRDGCCVPAEELCANYCKGIF